MRPSLARFLRRHQDVLVARVASELEPRLGAARARRESEQLVGLLVSAAAHDRCEAELLAARETVARWRAMGVARDAVGRAFAALIDPSEMFVDVGAPPIEPEFADLLHDARHEKEKFAALLTVSQAVASSLDLGTILETIAREVRRVIHVDEATVFLFDDERTSLRPVACDVESYRDEVMSCRLEPGQGITGSVALSGHGEIVNDALNDPRSVQVPGTPEERSALLCVPLWSRERVAGVITLVRIGSSHYFVEADLELAKLFAGQCSAAIANAQLFDEMRRAYDELRHTQSQLVQSAKLNALGEMAGGVAHDFNNILAAILGRTQLLLHRVGDPESRRQLQVIERAALDGAHAVRRVQEFTRVRQDEHFDTLDANQVLLEVIELTRPAWEADAKRHGIQVEVALDLQARQTIAGNASELREVFTNCVLNAVDAMPWGGSLQLGTRDADGEVCVTIRDTGVGMDAETVTRIFDPFFTTKAAHGTGLGLSVAYGIVTRHHGSIRVDSEPGVGTRFDLIFPAGAAQARGPRTGESSPLPQLDVLVVDDEEPVLSVMREVLEALGQRVVAVLGGSSGLEAFRAGSFDVVFSDLGMPEVNGWDLARAIRQDRPGTTFVLVTGWGSQLEEGMAHHRGVDFVVPKPFSLEEVETVLRQIGRRRNGDAAA